jgi:hypothetical protein
MQNLALKPETAGDSEPGNNEMRVWMTEEEDNRINQHVIGSPLHVASEFETGLALSPLWPESSAVPLAINDWPTT